MIAILVIYAQSMRGYKFFIPHGITWFVVFEYFMKQTAHGNDPNWTFAANYDTINNAERTLFEKLGDDLVISTLLYKQTCTEGS